MPPDFVAFVLFAIAILVMSGPKTSTLVTGAGAGPLLNLPGQMQAFNAVMAGLLVLSIMPMLAG